MVSDERGQLILVGAIAIALVVLGLVLIVNTALFTQIVGSEGTVESAKEGGVSGQAAGDALAAAVADSNLEHDDAGYIESDVIDDTNNTITPALRQRTLESSGAYVSVNYEGNEHVGSVITQTDSNQFTNSSNSPNWQPVPSTNTGDVGGFLATIDYSESDEGQTFTVRVRGTNGTGPNRTVSVTPRSGGVVNLSASGGVSCTGIPVTSGTVRIDYSAGAVYESSDCQFDLFDGLDPGYAVTFENGDGVEGTYTLATESDLDGNPHLDDSGTADQPTHTEAIWSFEYSFTYDSPDATVESESRVIDVYD